MADFNPERQQRKYDRANLSSYLRSAGHGSIAGMALGGLAVGSKGVQIGSMVGAAGGLAARNMLSKRIGKIEGRAMSRATGPTFGDNFKHAATNALVPASIAVSAAGLVVGRKRILKETGDLAARYRKYKNAPKIGKVVKVGPEGIGGKIVNEAPFGGYLNRYNLSSKLDSIISFADPRPRNSLGEFAPKDDETPSPEAIHKTYRSGVARTGSLVAGGLAAGFSGAAGKALFDKLKEAKLKKLGSKLDGIIEFNSITYHETAGDMYSRKARGQRERARMSLNGSSYATTAASLGVLHPLSRSIGEKAVVSAAGHLAKVKGMEATALRLAKNKRTALRVAAFAPAALLAGSYIGNSIAASKNDKKANKEYAQANAIRKVRNSMAASYYAGAVRQKQIDAAKQFSQEIEAIELKARNYKREYEEYHAKPSQKKRRAERNATRAKLEKKGRVHKGDGKDVHHKDGDTSNQSASNLRVESKSTNRARK